MTEVTPLSLCGLGLDELTVVQYGIKGKCLVKVRVDLSVTVSVLTSVKHIHSSFTIVVLNGCIVIIGHVKHTFLHTGSHNSSNWYGIDFFFLQISLCHFSS